VARDGVELPAQRAALSTLSRIRPGSSRSGPALPGDDIGFSAQVSDRCGQPVEGTSGGRESPRRWLGGDPRLIRVSSVDAEHDPARARSVERLAPGVFFGVRLDADRAGARPLGLLDANPKFRLRGGRFFFDFRFGFGLCDGGRQPRLGAPILQLLDFRRAGVCCDAESVHELVVALRRVDDPHTDAAAGDLEQVRGDDDLAHDLDLHSNPPLYTREGRLKLDLVAGLDLGAALDEQSPGGNIENEASVVPTVQRQRTRHLAPLTLEDSSRHAARVLHWGRLPQLRFSEPPTPA